MALIIFEREVGMVDCQLALCVVHFWCSVQSRCWEQLKCSNTDWVYGKNKELDALWSKPKDFFFKCKQK